MLIIVKHQLSEPIYHILLILTDGEIHDMTQTIDLVVHEASSLPLSIIIIGVGNEKFKMMRQLDSDNQLLVASDGTTKAARDIIQFVRFKRYIQLGPDGLAEKVLREVPKQFLTYMKQKGIEPSDKSESYKKPMKALSEQTIKLNRISKTAKFESTTKIETSEIS